MMWIFLINIIIFVFFIVKNELSVIKMDIIYIELKNEEINLIKPLWENLKEQHCEVSTYFPGKYGKFSFEERKAQILNKTIAGCIKIDIVKDKDNDQYIGYCVSSILENIGEVDSIYINENYRNSNIGTQLMKRSLHWMDKKNVINKKIVVAVGNEELFSFYKKFNFYPRHIIIEQK